MKSRPSLATNLTLKERLAALKSAGLRDDDTSPKSSSAAAAPRKLPPPPVNEEAEAMPTTTTAAPAPPTTEPSPPPQPATPAPPALAPGQLEKLRGLAARLATVGEQSAPTDSSFEALVASIEQAASSILPVLELGPLISRLERVAGVDAVELDPSLQSSADGYASLEKLVARLERITV